MTDQVEQSAATPNSEDTGSAASALGLGKSDYLEPSDFKPVTTGESTLGQGADEAEGEPEEDEEIEVGARKIALPKSVAETLKSERMMHADYTQKTQAAAEERRQIVAEREQVQRQAQEHQQYLGEIAKVVAINDQLAEFDKLDWEGLISADPVEAMRLQQQQRTLQSKREQAVNEVTNKQHQLALSEQQATAKQIQDAKAYFEREITGWNDALDTEVHKYTLAQGITNDHVVKIALQTPAVIKLAHKAMLYDRLVSKQAVPSKAPVVEARPAARVGGNASVKKDPTKMSDTEYANWAKNRIKNNR